MANKERRMAAHRQLMRVIYKKEQELTDEDIFLGKPYQEYQSKVADGLTEKYGAHSAVTIYKDDSKNGASAFTDGAKTHINAWCAAYTVQNRVQRHRCITGRNVHEQAHRVWTNIPLGVKAAEEIGKGNPYPDVLAENNEILYEAKKQLRLFITEHPEMTGAISSIYHSIDNCVCDGFVNKMALSSWPGYGQDLEANIKDQKKKNTSYSEQKAKGADNITLLTNLVLSEAKFGETIPMDPSDLQDPVVQSFYKTRSIIDDATDEMSSWFRQIKKNEIFLTFFKIITDECNKQNQQDPQNGRQGPQGNGQGGKGQSSENQNSQENSPSNGDPSAKNQQSGDPGNAGSSGQTNSDPNGQGNSSEAVKQALERAAKAAKEFSASTDSENSGSGQANGPLSDSSDSSSIRNTFGKSDGTTGSEGSSGSGSSPINDGKGGNAGSADMSSSLSKVINQTATEMVASEKETELERQLREAIKDVAHDANIHAGVPASMNRARGTEGQGLYDSEHSRLDGIAKRMVRNLLKEIKDRQLGDSLNGNYFGSRMDSQNLSRRDKKLFIRDVLPEDVPDMEVSVVVDQSGSMSGAKNMAAKKASYIIWKFCNMLEIPVNVLGHHTRSDTVVLESFADGSSIDGNDGIRILGMGTGGCNRDGYALRYALNKLYKSPAETKVLVMVSDGCPNHGSYGIPQAKADIQNAVAKAKKSGIVVVTAGIGDDAERIRDVWTEGVSPKRAARFLSISDLDKLSKTLIDVIKKQLV